MKSFGSDIRVFILIVRDKEFKVKSFVIGFNEYKKSGNQKRKTSYTQRKRQLIRENGKISKSLNCFLNANDNNICDVEVTDSRAVNLVDGKGMRVPCTLLLTGQSKFIDLLSKELCKHV